VPSVFPRPALLVTLTGIFEIVGAIALQDCEAGFLYGDWSLFDEDSHFFLRTSLLPAIDYLDIARRPATAPPSAHHHSRVFLVGLWFAGAPTP
jgi:hypothetical protein